MPSPWALSETSDFVKNRGRSDIARQCYDAMTTGVLGTTVDHVKALSLRAAGSMSLPPYLEPEVYGPTGLGRESSRSSEEDGEHDLFKLSPVGEVLRRAAEEGAGVLAVGRCVVCGCEPWCHRRHALALTRTGRPWVRYEGWLLKESGVGPLSSYRSRYFVVAGGKLEYYTEVAAKVSLKNAEGQSLGLTLQHANIVTKVDAGLALQQKALFAGSHVESAVLAAPRLLELPRPPSAPPRLLGR